jgi:hypothetical protein
LAEREQVMERQMSTHKLHDPGSHDLGELFDATHASLERTLRLMRWSRSMLIACILLELATLAQLLWINACLRGAPW